MNEHAAPDSQGHGSMALNATLALLAIACAALPLWNRVGSLEIGALLGVAVISTWTAWRATRYSRMVAESAAQASEPSAGDSGDAE